MNIESKVQEAILSELDRQAADGKLTMRRIDDDSAARVAVEGEVNLDDVIMAVVGSLAGGP